MRQLKRPARSRSCETQNGSNLPHGPTGQLAGGRGTKIDGKSVVSGQTSRIAPDIAPIFSLWPSLQACTVGRPVADIGPLGRPLGRPILIPANAAVAQW